MYWGISESESTLNYTPSQQGGRGGLLCVLVHSTRRSLKLFMSCCGRASTPAASRTQKAGGAKQDWMSLWMLKRSARLKSGSLCRVEDGEARQESLSQSGWWGQVKAKNAVSFSTRSVSVGCERVSLLGAYHGYQCQSSCVGEAWEGRDGGGEAG